MSILEGPFAVSHESTQKLVDLDNNHEEIDQTSLPTYLNDAFRIDKLENDDPKMVFASEKVILFLDKTLGALVSSWSLIIPDLDSQTLKTLIEIYRALRNCTSNQVTQDYIVKNTNILEVTSMVFKKTSEADLQNILLKLVLQFLSNLISSNKQAAEHVFRLFQDSLRICFMKGIYIYESSALLYNISMFIPTVDVEIENQIFGNYGGETFNEYISFYLEKQLATTEFWNRYSSFFAEKKLATLEILRDMQMENKSIDLCDTGLDILVQSFLESSDVVFQTKPMEEDNLRVQEVSLMLEIMSAISSDETYLKKLQLSKDLLINVGVLLINIHKLGKSSENCFTPVGKIDIAIQNSELKDHPAFGFKADLVRLIGNLCWKNLELQNLARTAELIPVILDCCNMDARNPSVIIQWCVLAIRNLCENNIENQKVIAGLHQKGTVSSAVLQEMGMTLHSDGENQLNIVSLESLKK